MRTYVSLTSALLVWLIYRRYRIDMEIQRAKQIVGPEGKPFFLSNALDTLKGTGWHAKFWVEVVLSLLHSPPGVNATFTVYQGEVDMVYTLDMFLTILTLMRVYSIL
jgi:hypothetical protein